MLFITQRLQSVRKTTVAPVQCVFVLNHDRDFAIIRQLVNQHIVQKENKPTNANPTTHNKTKQKKKKKTGTTPSPPAQNGTA
jgi:hypothetical protein